MRRSVWLAATWLLWLPALTSAQEWTRFHGPNGSGENEATTIPATWTENDYNWKIKLPGEGHSSPVLWGEKLFLLSADPTTATRYVLCYNAATGDEIWKQEFPSTPHHLHALSSFASCTPAVDAERVYVAWSTPASVLFMAFNHDGDTVWEKDLGPWFSQHGFGTSPMLVDDLVILVNSQEGKNGKVDKGDPKSYVMAFDAKTGEERWRTPRDTVNVAYSVPAILETADGGKQLVSCSTDNGVFALDIKTGRELWSLDVFDKRTVSSPLIKGDLIFTSCGSGGGGNYLTAVRSTGEQAELVYKVTTQAPYVPTSVARGDLLFMISDGGIASCVNLETGELHWRQRIGGNFYGSPVRAGDKIIGVSKDGEVIVLAASEEFQELGRVALGEICNSTPAIAHGRLYIRTVSHLMSIGGQKTN